MSKEFKEIKSIKDLTRLKCDYLQVEELAEVKCRDHVYPIHSFCFGSPDPNVPTLGLFGGVHGLEKIGTHVLTAFIETLIKQVQWDKDLQASLERSRIVSIPLINPGGMSMNWRSNPNGVDLMRNAPIEVDMDSARVPPLISGHRISNKIAWYRGQENAPMEIESQTLVDFVRKEIFPAPTSLTVDFHSGFGLRDRFWYPYAKTDKEFPRINDVLRLVDLLNETLPHHIYKIEPQSASYVTNGDLWDYLFDEHFQSEEYKGKTYIPWTLEMGSWNWVKKNPIQIFSPLGLFNPIKGHRFDRTMRRHKLLIDFLFKAIKNPESWAKPKKESL